MQSASYGQLGNGSFLLKAYVPIAVNTSYRFTAMSAGGLHTLALATTTSAVSWGTNSSGQLGNGTLNSSATPVVTLP